MLLLINLLAFQYLYRLNYKIIRALKSYLRLNKGKSVLRTNTGCHSKLCWYPNTCNWSSSHKSSGWLFDLWCFPPPQSPISSWLMTGCWSLWLRFSLIKEIMAGWTWAWSTDNRNFCLSYRQSPFPCVLQYRRKYCCCFSRPISCISLSFLPRATGCNEIVKNIWKDPIYRSHDLRFTSDWSENNDSTLNEDLPAVSKHYR